MSHTAEDLGLLATEASDPRFANLDTLSVAELAILMNTADHTVSYAVAAAFTTIVPALEAASERMAGGGGRLYVGAGAAGPKGGGGGRAEWGCWMPRSARQPSIPPPTGYSPSWPAVQLRLNHPSRAQKTMP